MDITNTHHVPPDVNLFKYTTIAKPAVQPLTTVVQPLATAVQPPATAAQPPATAAFPAARPPERDVRV